MPCQIESIEIFVREMPPDRMAFGIGKVDQEGKIAAAKKRRPLAILLTRLTLITEDGARSVGFSGDRPSFGWLDKRAELSPEEKLTLLLDLVESARDVYLELGKAFETPFELWQRAEPAVRRKSADRNAEDLMASYASALFERALLDAFCKMHLLTFFDAVKKDRLGIQPGKIHPQLDGATFAKSFPAEPNHQFAIRHTVGLSDPLTEDDLREEDRINDGEPETLAGYAKRDGLRYFKVKISGDAESDLERLGRIWNEVLAKIPEVAVTLDGNEAYTELEPFADFVDRFARELPGLFDHTLFIEQPLTRQLTLDYSTTNSIRKIARKKPLVIDEADGTTDAFRKAFAIGYSGCSHKNCKGVFKSLLNWALCVHFEKTTGRDVFLSGEDLSNMPIVPLHQDFAVLGVLGIEHCERNGHHYGFGLSHLTEQEKLQVEENHLQLYEKRNGEWFLRIENGGVLTYSLDNPGLGGGAGPEWEKLTPLADWRRIEKT
ncbi:MAG: hypothetical protein P1U87_03300 [Verrucomicrobiales bacterium]|nr:hypothetical protein [Verrucomicrobiales bacterium]